MRARTALTLIALCALPACAGAPDASESGALALASAPCRPESITVSPELPPEVQIAAARAVDAWCSVAAQTGWCPEIVDFGGAYSVRVEAFASDTCAAMRTFYGEGVLRIQPEWATASADDLDGPLAHELGHVAGIHGHVADSDLMRAGDSDTDAADVPCDVDAPAVAALVASQG